jgi:hypothetical protein
MDEFASFEGAMRGRESKDQDAVDRMEIWECSVSFSVRYISDCGSQVLNFHQTITSLSSLQQPQCELLPFITMDTLDGTSWDVVISGTGLPQSLLALYVCLASVSAESG